MMSLTIIIIVFRSSASWIRSICIRHEWIEKETCQCLDYKKGYLIVKVVKKLLKRAIISANKKHPTKPLYNVPEMKDIKNGENILEFLEKGVFSSNKRLNYTEALDAE